MIERPATVEDLRDITALWQRFEVATRGFTETDQASVSSDWQAVGFDLGRDTVLLADGGQVVGYALTDGSGDADSVADPARAAEGLEERLLAWLEHEGDARRTPLHHYWDAGDTAAQARFRERGWQAGRTYWRMRVDLDAPTPEPQWPVGVTVRGLDPERDGRTAHEIVRTAFADIGDGSGQRTWEEWEALMLSPDRFDAGLALVAQEAGEVVAVSMGELLPESAFVRQLAVPRAHRGRGLALAMLHETFRRAAQRGLPVVVLGVDAANATGAVRLYERAGMRIVEEFTRWDRPLPCP